MTTYSKYPLFAIAFFAILSCMSFVAPPAALTDTYLGQCETDPELTVTKTSSTSVLLTWDAWGSSGDYVVTLQNLTSQLVEQSFRTSSLSASVTNLTTGDTYRFSVERNGFVITEDVIM